MNVMRGEKTRRQKKKHGVRLALPEKKMGNHFKLLAQFDIQILMPTYTHTYAHDDRLKCGH